VGRAGAKASPKMCQEKPTKAKCLSPGYLETRCGRRHKATCGPWVRAKIKDAIEQMPGKKIQMLRPNGSDVKKDLRLGKSKAYSGPSASNAMASTGSDVFARSGLTSFPTSVSAASAKNAHRNPSWDANGEKIETCAEYAYEQLYDHMRFADAGAACKGSQQCVFDIAYMPGNPGIADRTLKRRDGKALPASMQIRLPPILGKAMPKNIFFALEDRVLYAGPGKSLNRTPEIDALAAELRKGKTHYRFTCKSGSCATNSYKNEWGWHADMESRLAKLSRAEIEEFARRRQQMGDLLQAWGTAVAKEKKEIYGGAKPPVTAHQWVHPLDTVAIDPFEQLALVTSYGTVANQTFKKMQQVLPKARMNKIRSLGGGMRTRGLVGMRGDSPAVSVLASPSPSTPVGKSNQAIPLLRTQMRQCERARYDIVGETVGIGPISCKISVLLRDEWHRKKRGQVSCLDRGMPDCDWSLEMFEDRVLRSIPSIDELQSHEEICLGLLPSKKFSPIRDDVGSAQLYLETLRAAIDKALRALSEYNLGANAGRAGRKLAGSWSDEDHFGDKEWFALGYEYDLGWSIEPTKRNGSSEVCQLAGDAHAELGVNSWVRYKRVPLVDAELSAKVNQLGEKPNRLHAHVKVFNVNLFTPADAEFSHAWSEPLADWSKDIPVPKPSFNVSVGIPITGSAWGQLGAGVTAGVEVELNGKCATPEAMKFGVLGRLKPTFSADGLAQVGIGVSGVASAGVRGLLNLVTIGVPIDVGLGLDTQDIVGAKELSVKFDAEVGLTLGTLSGYLALYVEALGAEAEHVLFRWKGLGPKRIELMKPVRTSIPLKGL